MENVLETGGAIAHSCGTFTHLFRFPIQPIPLRPSDGSCSLGFTQKDLPKILDFFQEISGIHPFNGVVLFNSDVIVAKL